MKKIFRIIQHRIERFLNVSFSKILPRHAVRFAKKYFHNKRINVIEVGVADGRNAFNMLKELNINKIFLIDSYENESYAKEHADEKLKDFKGKINWITKRSSKAVKEVPNAEFIYIDGNHNYKFVKEDMNNYYKVLKKGGIFAGHDITNNETGVPRAFVEFCYKNKLKPYISRTDWWVVK